MLSGQDIGRDLIGYADAPPQADWPGGARIAVQIVINVEEGAEHTVAETGRNEAGMAELAGGRVPPGERDLAFESMYEYGSRVGFWRLLAILRERSIPATAFACALALERNPHIAEAVVHAGMDVCCHGLRWEEQFAFREDEQRDRMAQAVESLSRTTGERPQGWYSRWGPSIHTRRLLVQEGGFLYDSDAYNDELPYWVRIEGRPHLVVPYAVDTNDAKFATVAGFASPFDFQHYLQAAFDRLYHEGEQTPRLMSIGLHPRITGHPARAHALAAFLDYAARHDKVWWCRRIDVARHWTRQHPASGNGRGHPLPKETS